MHPFFDSHLPRFGFVTAGEKKETETPCMGHRSAALDKVTHAKIYERLTERYVVSVLLLCIGVLCVEPILFDCSSPLVVDFTFSRASPPINIVHRPSLQDLYFIRHRNRLFSTCFVQVGRILFPHLVRRFFSDVTLRHCMLSPNDLCLIDHPIPASCRLCFGGPSLLRKLSSGN